MKNPENNSLADWKMDVIDGEYIAENFSPELFVTVKEELICYERNELRIKLSDFLSRLFQSFHQCDWMKDKNTCEQWKKNLRWESFVTLEAKIYSGYKEEVSHVIFGLLSATVSTTVAQMASKKYDVG